MVSYPRTHIKKTMAKTRVSVIVSLRMDLLSHACIINLVLLPLDFTLLVIEQGEAEVRFLCRQHGAELLLVRFLHGQFLLVGNPFQVEQGLGLLFRQRSVADACLQFLLHVVVFLVGNLLVGKITLQQGAQFGLCLFVYAHVLEDIGNSQVGILTSLHQGGSSEKEGKGEKPSE